MKARQLLKGLLLLLFLPKLFVCCYDVIPFKIEIDGITGSCFKLFIRFTSIEIMDLSRSLLENSLITLSSLLCCTFNNSLQIEKSAFFHMSSKLLSYSGQDGRTRKILFNVCRKSCTPVDLEYLLHCLLENSSLALGLG